MILIKYLVYSLVVLISVNALSFANNAQDQPEEEKVGNLQEKTWEIIHHNPDSALYLSKQQLSIASKNDDLEGIINAYFQIGYAYDELNYFDKAAEHYYKCLTLLKEKREAFSRPARKEAIFLQNLGISYEKTFGYDLAITCYNQALEIAKANELVELLGDLYLNIGVVHQKKKNIKSSIDSFKRAYPFYEKAGDQRNMAKIHNLMGLSHQYNEQYTEAITYFEKALAICDATGNLEKEKAWYISNIGETYFVQNEHEIALEYYLKALTLSLSLNDKEKTQWLYNNLGDVYLKEKKYDQAIDYYQKSISLSNTVEGNVDDERKRSYKNIAQAYDSIGNFQLASEFKSRYMAQTELLAQTKDKLQEQNAQYRMKEVEWQMERLAQNEQIQFYRTSVFWFRLSLSLIALVLVMISYFTYKYYRKIALARRLLNY